MLRKFSFHSVADLETVRQLEDEWHRGVDDESWATEESNLHEDRTVTGTLKDVTLYWCLFSL